MTIDLASMALTVHPYVAGGPPAQRGTERSDLDAISADDFTTFADWQEWRERLRVKENAEAGQAADLKRGHRDNHSSDSKRKFPAQRLQKEQAEPGSLASWRRQNGERKKFAPRHQLRANQNRVLHVLRSHPEGLPVDSIPGAAEKTMAHLAKLGLVESPVGGTSGDHIWRLSLYGKDELEREKIYLNWRSCSGLSHPDPI